MQPRNVFKWQPLCIIKCIFDRFVLSTFRSIRQSRARGSLLTNQGHGEVYTVLIWLMRLSGLHRITADSDSDVHETTCCSKCSTLTSDTLTTGIKCFTSTSSDNLKILIENLKDSHRPKHIHMYFKIWFF